MTRNEKYEQVIGLEIHAQLLTQSKLFCGDSIEYGAEPNTHISPVTLAHPGTLPKMNKKAIELAVRLGLACNSVIEKENYFARKNYFYPDLPKGYQISQHSAPICRGGFIIVKVNGEKVKILLNRIHIEEDAGKSMHSEQNDFTEIDFNRAGTALVEIVTEPVITNSDEATAFLTELRKLVRYLEVCDGNMEEGSMRCDANISVRIKGEKKLGTKVEIKNLNSIRNVKRAIEYETDRMIRILENGGSIQQQTLGFNADDGTTYSLRDKEDADDYRYFPEPDLSPFSFSDEFLDAAKEKMPELPAEKEVRYMSQFGLSEYDAVLLAEEKEFADFFEDLILFSIEKKSAANWMLGPVKSWLNETGVQISNFPVQPKELASLISLVEENKLSFSVASSKILNGMINQPGSDPFEMAKNLNLLQESNLDYITPLTDEVLLQFDEKVKAYRKGKKGLLAFFVGEVMKRSKGKADPKLVNNILIEKLKND